MNPAIDDRITSLVDLAEAYSRARNFRKVLGIAGEIIHLAPRDGLGYRIRGTALFHLKRYREARESLERAVAIDPRSDVDHYRLATVLLCTREYKRAGEHLRQAIDLNPQSAEYWAQLANLAHEQSDGEEVRRCARRALEIDPEDCRTLASIGFSHLELGESARRCAAAAPPGLP